MTTKQYWRLWYEVKSDWDTLELFHAIEWESVPRVNVSQVIGLFDRDQIDQATRVLEQLSSSYRREA